MTECTIVVAKIKGDDKITSSYLSYETLVDIKCCRNMLQGFHKTQPDPISEALLFYVINMNFRNWRQWVVAKWVDIESTIYLTSVPDILNLSLSKSDEKFAS